MSWCNCGVCAFNDSSRFKYHSRSLKILPASLSLFILINGKNFIETILKFVLRYKNKTFIYSQ